MIVVTGGAGYVGSHIVKKLIGAGKPVRVLVHNRERAEREGRLRGLPIEWAQGDVTNPESLDNVFEDADVVIHTVAIAIEKGTKSYEEINAEGTKNVLEAAEKSGVTRFINLSQLGADPNIPYRFLASKGKAQVYVTNSGLEWTAFRPSVIWGPEDEFANTFARLVRITPLIFPLVDKEAQFEPIWVDDVATCILESVDEPATIGKEYEIGGPEVLSLEEIERRTLRAVEATRIFVPFPKPLLRFIVSIMELLLPSPPVTSSLLELLAVDNVTKKNRIYEFVDSPRPFTPENTAAYMQEFTAKGTLKQFFTQ